MEKNKMKEVAQLLGVELNKPFIAKGYKDYKDIFKLTEENGLVNKKNERCNFLLINLLLGENEIEKSILDDVEKRYLESVLKPFKDVIDYVSKHSGNYEYYIHVSICDDENCMGFPNFKKGTMYKGMEDDKKYTLKELGLFQEE